MTQAARMPAEVLNFPQRKTGTERAKKETVVSKMWMPIRRHLVVLANTVFGNMAFYLILGVFNRATGFVRDAIISSVKNAGFPEVAKVITSGRPIRSTFNFYSVSLSYQRTMIPDWYAPIVRWKPGLGQVIKEDGYWTLSFGITSNEKDFYDPAKERKLREFYADADRIRKIIGAEQMTFSGILPSRFAALGIRKEEDSPENKNTVVAVMKALNKVTSKERLAVNTPVVVLGGRGFIGRRIVQLLEERGRQVYSVDIADGTNKIPVHLYGKRIIVMNISKKGQFANYIPFLWEGVVVINEVYPEASPIELELLRKMGVLYFHISGVDAFALPGFQKAYKKAIPCCAARQAREIIVARLA
jgi:hypothetical protein